jgi:alkylated DNA repair dioxygenase AlkB
VVSPSSEREIDVRRAPLVRRFPGWLHAAEADRRLAELLAEVPWKQEHITLFGRRHAMPRLSCWMADPGCDYRYSDLQNVIEPWCHAASELRERVSAELGCRFNSLLLNLYRDGRDAMGWHSDDEPELDAGAPIASLSLGAARTFRFRSRSPDGPRPVALELGHGELVVMDAPTQEHWQHALPRRLRVRSPRVNLTFRVVRPSP